MARAISTTRASFVCSIQAQLLSSPNNDGLEPNYLSCSANAHPNITDSCCSETFGGLVLSTQFWDTYTGLESTCQVLPKNTWSLHGLWPDFCNGSFTQYCDLKYALFPIALSIADFSQPTIRPLPLSKHHYRYSQRRSSSGLQRPQHLHFPRSLRKARPPSIHEQVLDQPRWTKRRLLGSRIQ